MDVHGDYKKSGYAHLQGLLPAAVAQEFLAHLKADMGIAPFPLEKLMRQAPPVKRKTLDIYAYEYRPMLMLLYGLTPTMSEVTGCDVLPSYCYFRVYRQGDICMIHSDRLACEHSLSLTLGYSEEKPWSFEIARDRTNGLEPMAENFQDKGYSSVVMRPGDAVLYQGPNYRHGRITPNPNRWSAHLFLHWVDSAGAHKEHAFDGRATTEKPDFVLG